MIKKYVIYRGSITSLMKFNLMTSDFRYKYFMGCGWLSGDLDYLELFKWIKSLEERGDLYK